MKIDNKVLDRRVKAFFETHGTTGVTMQEFAKLTGISYKSVRNRKHLYTDRGVVFVSAHTQNKEKRKALKAAALAYLSSTNKDTYPLSETLIKDLLNREHEKRGLPCPFPPQKTAYTIVEPFYSKYSAEIFNRALTSKSFHLPLGLKADLIYFVRYVHKHHCLRIEDREERLLIDSFKETSGVYPTEEQQRCVWMSYKHLTKRNAGVAVIQSVAGSSKTTCIKALRALMAKLGENTPPVISVSNRSLKDLEDGQTVTKYLNDFLGSNIVGVDYRDIRKLFDLVLESQGQCETLIVDEYSLVDPHLLDLLIRLSNNILLVGDSQQIARCETPIGSVLESLTKQYRFLKSETDLQETITNLYYKKDYEAIDQLVEERASGTFSSVIVPCRDGINNRGKSDYKGSFDDHVDALEAYKGLDDQIVAYANSACEEINTLLNGGASIKVGSKVILKQKEHKAPNVAPGSILTVVEDFGSKVKCYDKESAVIATLPKNKLELAYCITSTVAQGSAWDRVLVIVGTAPKLDHYADIYSAFTRGKKSVEFLVKVSSNTALMGIYGNVGVEEGNRNNAIFQSVMANVLVSQEAGLPNVEIVGTLQRAITYVMKETNEELPSKLKTKLKPLCSTYKPVGNARFAVLHGDTPGIASKHFCLTREQAERRLASSKNGGVIVENLHGGDLVVIDCDGPASYEAFLPLASMTNAHLDPVNKKAHIVFRTDKKIYRNSKGADLDFLGNASFQQRRYKTNKVDNGLPIADLPSSVLVEVERYIGSPLEVI